MQVRQYNPSDKEQIDTWCRSREEPIVPSLALPENGFIVDNHAAGFLYIADGGLGIIDNYITPSGLRFQERNEALDLVTKALIERAKELGIITLISFTQIQAICDRALYFGFKDMGNYRMCSKIINKIEGLA